VLIKKLNHDESKSWTLIFFLVVASFLVRLSPLRQEMPPYSFCDEDIFSIEALRLVTTGSWLTSEFRAGGMNIFPTVIIGKILQFFGQDVTLTTSITIGRFVGPILLGSLTTSLIYLITFEISKKRSVAVLASIFFIASPAVYAYGRISYPDHYIYFFSAGFLYYLLKTIRNQPRLVDFIMVGVFLGSTTSVKYTGASLLIPYGAALSVNLYRNRQDSAKLAVDINRSVCTLIASLFTFLVINLSAFFEPRAFVGGFLANIQNYERFEGSVFSGTVFYLFVSYFMLFGFLGGLIVIAGYANVWRKERRLFFVFFAFPTLLSFILSTAGLVFNRNVSITLPFVIPVMAWGAHSLFLLLRAKIGNNKAIFCALIFFLQPIYSLGVSLSNDLKQDSRLVASLWLKENVPKHMVIGVNESCSGKGPASTAGFQIQTDPFLDQKKEYYVFVHYWGTPFDDFYRKNVGIAQVVDQKYLHFDHVNDRTIFRFPKQKPTLDDLTPIGYEIVKLFSSNGPDVIVLKRIE